MIECDLLGENCFHWYHGSCVGIAPVNGRHLEIQGEPFICPFCTMVPCLPPFSALLLIPPISPGDLPLLVGQFSCEKFNQAYESIVHWKHESLFGSLQ